ncbi:hypothetical protein [Rhodohalobacter sp.]|uniref:hypothetical protein n=1 Tax=Rhodohalobacter sp. TaxID=1974210 RepID=UPI002ACEF5CA|nr:hypothetical protein [Rhodohalobacter sp.]MDZ7756403.1 hypothetical protein [Rhodohalobacter sp.]
MSDSSDNNGLSPIEQFIPTGFYDVIRQERVFIGLIGVFFFIAGVAFPYAELAMWVGFFFAGYSAIANDSIQTIGTFLASNMDKKWWMLWLWIGGIFLLTVTASWFIYDGDVTYQRLTSKGFSEAPTSFSFLQVAAPIFLLILTRMRMPVSTTFLLLSAFSSSAEGITSVLGKSLSGYGLALITGLVVWVVVTRTVEKKFNDEPKKFWLPLQWVISGTLWAVWVMQDAANIAVYLPRSLSLGQFLGFALFIFFGLGLLFYLRGDKIQQIVTEKSRVTDVRSATMVDFIYSILLVYKLSVSTIPMSTTWVFLGLLAGREIGMSIMDGKEEGRPMRKVLFMVFKDVSYALIGLIVSIILAISINAEVRDELLQMIGY